MDVEKGNTKSFYGHNSCLGEKGEDDLRQYNDWSLMVVTIRDLH